MATWGGVEWWELVREGEVGGWGGVRRGLPAKSDALAASLPQASLRCLASPRPATSDLVLQTHGQATHQQAEPQHGRHHGDCPRDASVGYGDHDRPAQGVAAVFRKTGQCRSERALQTTSAGRLCASLCENLLPPSTPSSWQEQVSRSGQERWDSPPPERIGVGVRLCFVVSQHRPRQHPAAGRHAGQVGHRLHRHTLRRDLPRAA